MIPKTQETVATIIGVGVLIISGAATVAIFLVAIPAANETLVGQAIGTLYSLLGMVVAFFYGSSVGSRKSQDTISTLANTAHAAQATLSAATGVTPGEVTLQAGDEVKVTAEDK